MELAVKGPLFNRKTRKTLQRLEKVEDTTFPKEPQRNSKK